MFFLGFAMCHHLTPPVELYSFQRAVPVPPLLFLLDGKGKAYKGAR